MIFGLDPSLQYHNYPQQWYDMKSNKNNEEFATLSFATFLLYSNIIYIYIFILVLLS
jgi:hypothetical protein